MRRCRLAEFQHPKPEWALVDRTGHEQCTCDSSRYHWNQCLRVGAGIKGSGEHDDRQAWRCPDCGLELQDVESSCCKRCGSINPVEWR